MGNYLPEMKTVNSKIISNVTTFGGMNIREDAQEGEFLSCKNLSTKNYPAISPREGRTECSTYNNPTGLFAWDKLVVCDEDKLYYDGNLVGNVSVGEKQFAVINTKLCIFPDKKYIDLTDGKCKNLESFAEIASASLTHNSISGTVSGFAEIQQSAYAAIYVTIGMGCHEFYIYDTLSFDETSGAPILTGGAWVDNRNMLGANLDQYIGKYIIPAGDANAGYTIHYRLAFAGSSRTTEYGTPNTDGVYGIISKIYYDKREYENVSESNRTCDFILYAQLSRAEPTDISSLFSVGDTVSVKSVIKPNEGKFKITDIAKRNGTILFGDNSFVVPDLYGYVDGDWDPNAVYDGNKYFRYFRNENIYSNQHLSFEPKKWHYDGELILMNIVNDVPEFTFYDDQKRITEHVVGKIEDQYYGIRVESVLYQRSETIKISRDVPDLDFVCESSNRLWGVSNKAENTLYDENGKPYAYEGRCIYASALGDPSNFFIYEGLSTDSYAVGVASKDDFTAISSYSDDVLCFKENEMIRIAGSYPENYYMYQYSIPGVLRGCHKSLQTINEVLYYVSTAGVFGYTGSTPRLISYKIGDGGWQGGVAGTDGRRYYMSIKTGADVWELVTYDTVTDLWMEEDDTHAVDFCTLAGVLYLLSGQKLYSIGVGTEGVMWQATLHPFHERSFDKKYYNYISIRGDLDLGASIAVYARFDSGVEKLVAEIDEAGSFSKIFPLPVNRSDAMQIRLQGVGECKIFDLQRTFRIGGA